MSKLPLLSLRECRDVIGHHRVRWKGFRDRVKTIDVSVDEGWIQKMTAYVLMHGHGYLNQTLAGGAELYNFYLQTMLPYAHAERSSTVDRFLDEGWLLPRARFSGQSSAAFAAMARDVGVNGTGTATYYICSECGRNWTTNPLTPAPSHPNSISSSPFGQHRRQTCNNDATVIVEPAMTMDRLRELCCVPREQMVEWYWEIHPDAPSNLQQNYRSRLRQEREAARLR